MKKYFKLVLNVILFVIFIYFIIINQKSVGLNYLFKMLIGLFGLIILLWNYNKRNK